ncbi:MAG: prolyl oligopeptidase family serine peptidase [Planctomycetota bacterium]|nr:prolyl oligopeptidase family serine peptidase [Planctomycetota bacterium]
MKLRIAVPVLLVVVVYIAGCTPVDEREPQAAGQSAQSFEKEIKKTVRLNYLLYLPPGHQDAKAKWPLMLFLHGAGERGSDLEKVKVHGPPKLIAKEGKTFPFVIVSPQCPEDGWWPGELQLDALDGLLDDVVSRYRIDKDRIYVTGLSMGGFGTWQLAFRYPGRFAALAPICGRGDPKKVDRIKHVPVWVFHGAKDKTVPLKDSQEMVDALKKAGADPKFTVYPDADHDSWTATYNDPAFYEWLLAQRRGANQR